MRDFSESKIERCGHKTQKTFMDYIKLSSDEITDETDAIVNANKGEIF